MIRFTRLRSWLLLCAMLAGTASFGAAIAGDDKSEGFTDLFNGRDLSGWKTFLDKAKNADPAKTWTVKDGMIVCTGHPNGFLYTDKSYKDYVLLYDWQYKRPEGLTDENRFLGNSGCLVHIHNAEKPVLGVWPRCIEVQGMNRDHGRLLPIPRTIKGKEAFDREAKNKATHPVGEWNTTEITCKEDGSIIVKINGTQVNSGRYELTEGMIGFQSEGAEIHFRNIRIKERK